MTKALVPPPSPDGANGRSADGRFAAGNPGGKGNPYAKRVAELRKAFLDVVGTEHMAGLARATLKKALQGDMIALRTLLDRVLGKPRDADQDPVAIPIDMPGMGTAEGCSLAVQRLTSALVSGDVSQDAAKVLADLIQLRAKTIELAEFEKRLKNIETSIAERTGKARRQ